MKTADLIAQAEATGQPLTRVATAIGLAANTLHVAKERGRLSPGTAAALAAHLGEPVARWTLQAVIEGERSAALKRKLQALARAMSYFWTRARASRTVAPGRPTAAPIRSQVQPFARSSRARA
jgi:hypothetical protein